MSARLLFGRCCRRSDRHQRLMLGAVILLTLTSEWLADTLARLV